MTAMRALGASDLLSLWEHGAQRHALDRSAMLCAWARPDVPPEAIADLPLGTVTASLMQLREISFGARIEGRVDCTHCGVRLDLDLHGPDLLQPLPSGKPEVEVRGLRLRAPSLRDLAAIADELDIDDAAGHLLARCVAAGDADAMALAQNAWDEVELALQALDPNADVTLSVRCEACGSRSSAQLDAGGLLWAEIDIRARRLLSEVHMLAQAYGWSESEVLALGASRRAVYLDMVAA